MATYIRPLKRTNVSLRPFNSGNLELVKLLFPAIKVCSEQKNKQHGDQMRPIKLRVHVDACRAFGFMAAHIKASDSRAPGILSIYAYTHGCVRNVSTRAENSRGIISGRWKILLATFTSGRNNFWFIAPAVRGRSAREGKRERKRLLLLLLGICN